MALMFVLFSFVLMVLRKVVFFVALNFCRRLDWIEEEEEEEDIVIIVDSVLCSPRPVVKTLSLFLSFFFVLRFVSWTYVFYLSPPLVVVVVVVLLLLLFVLSRVRRFPGWMMMMCFFLFWWGRFVFFVCVLSLHN